MNYDIKEIGMIAACLSDNHMEAIYERSDVGYINALELISDWAKEFYDKYAMSVKDWGEFLESEANPYKKAICWDDFVMMWGAEKVKSIAPLKRTQPAALTLNT